MTLVALPKAVETLIQKVRTIKAVLHIFLFIVMCGAFLFFLSVVIDILFPLLMMLLGALGCIC